MREFTKFKDEKERKDYFFLHPFLRMIECEMAIWCQSKGLEWVITETLTSLKDDLAMERISKAHREGRAFDARCKDWSQEHQKEFVAHFNERYAKKCGAISKSDGVPRLVVHHSVAGSEIHFHVQLRPEYSNP